MKKLEGELDGIQYEVLMNGEEIVDIAIFNDLEKEFWHPPIDVIFKNIKGVL
ncbi:hypothetical protein ACWE42_07530 [Sutcliffiella cohnii]